MDYMNYIKDKFNGCMLLHSWRDGEYESYVIGLDSDILFVSVGKFRGLNHHVIEKTLRNGFNKNGVNYNDVQKLTFDWQE